MPVYSTGNHLRLFRRTCVVLGALLGGILLLVGDRAGNGKAVAQEKLPPGGITKMSTPELIIALDAADGKVRTAATAELFRRGKDALPVLQKAGAKQIAPVGASVDGTRRLDAVYSLIAGLPPNQPGALAGYLPDSFGIHVAPGVTVADVAVLAQKYNLSLMQNFRADSRPNCYVRIGVGQNLADVLRRVLSEEPGVKTVNLNYFDR